MSKTEYICTQLIPDKNKNKTNIINNLNSKNPLKAAFYKDKLWPQNSVLTIGFYDLSPNISITPPDDLKRNNSNSEPDPLQLEFYNEYQNNKSVDIIKWIKRIIKSRYERIVNLRFDFINDVENAKIRIDFDESEGSYSYVGTDSLKQKGKTTNFGWFDVATVMHEMGHVLGLIHEHQNPDGENIKWNIQKLNSYMEETQGWSADQTYIQIVKKYDVNQINGSLFDPLSIMEYFFPANLTKNKKGIKQNLRLSGLDVKYISKSYPKKDMTIEELNNIYESWYNESIEENIKKSKQLNQQLQSPSSINTQSIILIVIGCVLGAIIIAFIIYFSVRK
tara:strand:- start:3391 stop:4395 length:1005 start_codon:yes stop_codon:yes gene_type:complete